MAMGREPGILSARTRAEEEMSGSPRASLPSSAPGTPSAESRPFAPKDQRPVRASARRAYHVAKKWSERSIGSSRRKDVAGKRSLGRTSSAASATSFRAVLEAVPEGQEPQLLKAEALEDGLQVTARGGVFTAPLKEEGSAAPASQKPPAGR